MSYTDITASCYFWYFLIHASDSSPSASQLKFFFLAKNKSFDLHKGGMNWTFGYLPLLWWTTKIKATTWNFPLEETTQRQEKAIIAKAAFQLLKTRFQNKVSFLFSECTALFLYLVPKLPGITVIPMSQSVQLIYTNSYLAKQSGEPGVHVIFHLMNYHNYLSSIKLFILCFVFYQTVSRFGYTLQAFVLTTWFTTHTFPHSMHILNRKAAT